MRKVLPFIIEAASVEDANNVDIDSYRLSERISAEKGVYVFVRRANK